MTIFELADLLEVDLIFTRYACQDGRWTARLKHCEVAEGGCLTGAYGNGDGPDNAMREYAKKIAGKRLVFDAMTDKRREFVAPKGLTT